MNRTDAPAPNDLDAFASINDDDAAALRQMLMLDLPPFDHLADAHAPDAIIAAHADALASIIDDEYSDITLDHATDLMRRLLRLDRDRHSMLALAHSLCPLHRIDYAICFDDDDPECAAIRACFPLHDT